jgi:hypothetical protein
MKGHDMQQALFEVQQLSGLAQYTKALEHGQIIYLPKENFHLKKHEEIVFDTSLLQARKKNISYDYTKQTMSGLHYQFMNTPTRAYTQQMMHRFAEHAKHLVETLFPEYENHLIWGRTSYRPATVENRPQSKRKDDRKLHVDAFVATPVQGLRILRIFSNINPHQEARVWNVGEPFDTVLNRFHSKFKPYRPSLAKLMKQLKMTKSLRTAYDHYMLQLHDQMKMDDQYQAKANKQEIKFPTGSTWIVFTDQVSHAALAGQYLLEQTFYLPVNAMQNPEYSPLKQLQNAHPHQIMI